MSVCVSSCGLVIDAIYLVPIDWRRLYDLAIAFNISLHTAAISLCL